jgi:phospho-N-acetylmuramoyl-pentapeptide-transferase
MHLLPTDRGKEFACQGERSKGKPQAAGVIFIPIFVITALLVVPTSIAMIGILFCVLVAMTAGFLDDKSEKPWGRLLKGSLDLAISIVAAYFVCHWSEPTVWFPFTTYSIVLPEWLFILISSPILWIMINSTNCSDGVDALAGTLSLFPLTAMAIFLYVVIGHYQISEYLLIPQNSHGASWAIMLMALAGSILGYLWHNAEPSLLLMGDAGSRAIGLILGVGVLVSGNFFLGLIVAPVILINGGGGLIKIGVIKVLQRLGIATVSGPDAKPLVRLIHKFRFPLHDHCRKELKWSNGQVLMRFSIIQVLLLTMLFTALIKMR